MRDGGFGPARRLHRDLADATFATLAVRLDHAEAGNTDSLVELLPRIIEGGIAAVSPNGVLGDPAGASAAEGRRVLDEMVRKIVGALDEPLRP